MIQFPPVRSLMQVKEEDTKAENVFDALLISLGAIVCVGAAFVIIACLFHKVQDRKMQAQDRKYTDWTEKDGMWPEFSQTEVNPRRRNPLHIAIEVSNLPLVRALVDGGHQKCNDVDRRGLYALHFAAASHSMEILKYVAENTPKDFRPEGHSPLHVAANIEDFNALGYLIEHFPELQRNRDRMRETYLDVLCVETSGQYPFHVLKTGKRYGQFIQEHRDSIPNELFQGFLTPYRDFSQDQVVIGMQTADEEKTELLSV